MSNISPQLSWLLLLMPGEGWLNAMLVSMLLFIHHAIAEMHFF
jgi:hypothetical protein